MANKNKLLKLLLGFLIGFFISHLVQNKAQLCSSSQVKEQEVLPTPDTRKADSKEEGLIFVGVMTAAKYIETRAQAIHETWGQKVPGRLIFFSSEASYSKSLPLVSLVGIDDSYPPQKKSFAMLKYMHDNYIDQFEWFMRADDDVYVRMDRLEKLLRSVDSRKPWFIGQTGKGNNDEFGLLSLEHDENFCMGGPGVILSRETLKRIAPYMEQCLSNLFTTHEDVELGRCVKKFAGISCTWSYEMQVILYHNQSGEAAFSGNLKQREVHRAITLHPVKQPQYMHRLHNYVKGLQIQDYRHRSLTLHRDILASLSFINAHIESDINIESALFTDNEDMVDSSLLGIPLSLTRSKSKHLKDILDWEFFSKSLYSHRDLNPRKRLGSTIKEGLSDIIREVMDLINSHSKQRGRVIDFKDVFYGYWRLDPVHGVDVILDLLLVYRKYRGHKMTVPVRRHAYIQQTFTGIDIREVTEKNTIPSAELPFHQKMLDSLNIGLFSENNTNKKQVTFILPLKGRYHTFKRFIMLYEDVCIKRKEPSRLIIVLYRDEVGLEYDSTMELISKVKNNVTNDITVIHMDESFSRGRALQFGAKSLNDDDLMFFIDADIVFNSNTLVRIRQNTVQSKSVYFPIVYSLYNPDVFNKTYVKDYTKCENFDFLINEENGFWRQFGFGIVSLYKSDFLKIGGFNMSIVGWGLEDVTFYDNAIKTDIHVVRSVDPSLIHVYHPIYCDTLDGSQKSMCLGTKSSLFGSLHDLENYLFSNKHLLR